MSMVSQPNDSPERIAALLLRLSPLYAQTPLLELPKLASEFGVAQVLVKNEAQRALGSFKSLGGTYAGLMALARATGVSVDDLLDPTQRGRALSALITASAGNHGLAVAAAAKFAGGPARIYLYPGVPKARVRRIEAEGAEIVWVEGTYDDAVDQAAAAARAGEGILVADTSADPDDQPVADIVAGYGVMAAEIRRQVEAGGSLRPTHLFIQAGVGGLAAAMAAGLSDWLAAPAKIVVVEPTEAPCVAAAFAEGAVVRIAGKLDTSAGMLACGEASAPALRQLQAVGAEAIDVSEVALAEAVAQLAMAGGPATTTSGATGLAGLMIAACSPELRQRLGLTSESRVLIIVSETALETGGSQ
ncbi:pyridoxal-phosphate dependent enzyme [Bosea caraganae]|uniref:Pyridoxal-phosphate dependent enzyme n=1 Tax=Bosea caraganae TaxID=2763117 RepID=A0A370L0J1_9HYPH|nr:pyridoxal-phosphate dependent enzyme [Bosea caraganae]RDJ20789.1 pyridoxal-phosphate dependent enzyme [Bosea caraganae]RDJ21598.1 pyridoxal-phosphate dependent enzyme [Bosea caraganae]